MKTLTRLSQRVVIEILSIAHGVSVFRVPLLITYEKIPCKVKTENHVKCKIPIF
jgi:hypothetical protein